MKGTGDNWKSALARTSKAAFGRIALVLGTAEINESTWEDVEEILIQADFGYQTSKNISDNVRNLVYKKGITSSVGVLNILREVLLDNLETPVIPAMKETPYIILLVGVNGSGKTTTAAKLGHLFKSEGKKIILIAADTYRAAATEQLNNWADKLNIPCISGAPGSDPGSVVYDGIQAAISKKVDIAIIDTAGRLQTNFNLMEEIKKISRVAGKSLAGAPHATWLVLDATTGQNSIQQARVFSKDLKLSGVIIAKLDSSAKGGMIFSIKNELNIPILYSGLGEKLENISVFDPRSFINGLFA